jgi:hypothetical protein
VAAIGQIRKQCEAVCGYKDHVAPQAQCEGRRTGSGQGKSIIARGSKVFRVLTRGVDNAIRPNLAAGHLEAAYARRLERGQGTYDPREQCRASLGQCAESAGRRRGEDGCHEPEDYCSG